MRPGVPFQLIKDLCDPEGRFVMIIGRLVGNYITLLNVYAPIVNQSGFMTGLLPQVSEILLFPRIVGGDFNCVSDVHLDRSHPPLQSSPIHKTSKVFTDWQKRWGLVDS